jgi:hypothetical protein
MYQINTKLSPEAQKLYDRDMEIIDYEIARENINAVLGQYSRERYKERKKENSDEDYIELLNKERSSIRDILDFMYEFDQENIEKLNNEYGKLFKENKKLKNNGQKIVVINDVKKVLKRC